MALVEQSRGSAIVPYEGRVARRAPRGPAPIDLRFRWPLRWALVVAVFVGAAVANVIVGFVDPPTFEGQVLLIGLKTDDPSPKTGVEIIDSRLQSLTSLARSEPFLYELQRRAGLSLSIDELKSMVTAARPKLGALISIRVTGTDEAEVRALSDQLVTTLDVMIDRVREGSLLVLDEEGRNPFAGESSQYTGPVYVDLFGRRPYIAQIQPSFVTTAFAGGGLAALLLLVFVLWSHERTIRVTSNEDLEELIGLPAWGTVPRPGLRPRRRRVDHAKGLALALDGRVPDGLSVLAMAGRGAHRERASLSLVVGAGLASTLDRDVVIIDMDLQRGDVSRRCGALRGTPRWTWSRLTAPGLSDAIADHRSVVPSLRRLRPRHLPFALRGLLRAPGPSVWVLPAGRHVGQPFVVDDGAMSKVLAEVSYDALVVVHLPVVPGPIPVREVLGLSDCAALVLLDGWSILDDAIETSGVMFGAGVSSGVLLLEN